MRIIIALALLIGCETIQTDVESVDVDKRVAVDPTPSSYEPCWFFENYSCDDREFVDLDGNQFIRCDKHSVIRPHVTPSSLDYLAKTLGQEHFFAIEPYNIECMVDGQGPYGCLYTGSVAIYAQPSLINEIRACR